MNDQSCYIKRSRITAQFATAWQLLLHNTRQLSSLRYPSLIVFLALSFGCTDPPTEAPTANQPQTKPTPALIAHWCNLAEAIQKDLYREEVGSLFGWRGHVCSESNVYDVNDHQVLVMAHYVLTFGPVSYTLVFDARESASPIVLCESVLLECIQRPEVTAIVVERLASHGHRVHLPDGIWSETIEKALWGYGAVVGLTRANANLELVTYALMTGIVQPIK